MSEQNATQRITLEDAAAIARLARLEPSEEALGRIARQCNDILDYMELLNQAATDGVAPLYSPVEQPTPLREDVASRSCTREEILSNAPETDGRFFIVPKIV